jgi:competence protein ComEC
MHLIQIPYFNRPLVVIAFSLALGIQIANHFSTLHFGFFLFLVVIGILLAFVTQFSVGWRNTTVLCMFIGVGGLLWIVRYAGPPGDSISTMAIAKNPSVEFTITGKVIRPDIYLPESEYTQCILQVARVDSIDRQSGRILIRWLDPQFPLNHGDLIQVQGLINTSMGKVNPNSAGVEGYYRRHDVHSVLQLKGGESILRLETSPWYSVPGWASRFRNHVASRLQQVVPAKALPFVLTVWLGDRRSIDDTTYTQFMESGTAHILAVSGVHIGIIYVSLAFILQLFLPSNRSKTILIMVMVFLFAFIAGARISSLRAALMIGLYLTAELWDRESDAPSTLGLSAVLFLVHRPAILFDPGFQLSYLSISSLMLFRPVFSERLQRVPFWFRENIATTMSVQLLPWPVVISQFHIYPLYGLLANLIVIPLLSATLWLAFLTSFFALLGIPLASVFAQTLGLLTYWILGFTEWVANLPGAIHYFTSPTSLAIIFYWVLLILCLKTVTASNWNRRTVGLIVFLLALIPLTWTPRQNRSEITFLDVGHGDSTFIQTSNGHRFLIDSGDKNPFYDAGKRDVAPFLWNNHIGHLDGVLLTHSDRDHIGGLEYLIGKIDIGRVYLSTPDSQSPLEDRILDKCRAYGIPIERVSAGDRIVLGNASLEVVHPPPRLPDDTSDNNRSIVCRMDLDGVTFLFTGDIEEETEKLLLERNIQADILKVPHHGSTTSSTAEFIQAVRPTVAVISVGQRRRYDSVKEAILERYDAENITLFRTDIEGGRRILPKNGRITSQSSRELHGFPLRKNVP